VPSSTIRPAGREVELWNDDLLTQLRQKYAIPDDFLNDGWSYDNMQSGGGKGGTLMAFLWGKYIVKEMSKGDHKCMLAIAHSYVKHLCDGDSMICTVLLHYKDVDSGRCFFVMRNEVGNGPFKALYDKKGCADDKILEFNGKPRKAMHKRCWNFSMWCGKCRWSHERHAYYAGKKDAAELQVRMPEDQRAKLVQQLAYDTEWMINEGLMDYSLLIALRADAPTIDSKCAYQAFEVNGNKLYLGLSIIDFLQQWGCGKRCARAIKASECNKATVPPGIYGKRFQRHFEQCFSIHEPTALEVLGKEIQPESEV